VYEIRRPATFDAWLTTLNDSNARARIAARIDRLATGNPGDVKPVGGGVSEMRVDYGPGYRVYYVRTERVVSIALRWDESYAGRGYQTCDRNECRKGPAGLGGSTANADAGEMTMATRARKTERFARYDSADYLKTPEDVAEYLVAAFEEGGDDAAYMAHVIGVAARAHGGMTKLAKETGMTRAGLYKALSKDGNPSFETIVKAMRVLGVRLVPRVATAR
jgi:probable addiction module antidote protein/putative addiction module killer protein